MPEHYFFSLKEDLLGGETVGEDGIVLALAGCAFPFPLAAGALKSLWHSILGFVVAGLSQLNACGIFVHFCFFRPRASSVQIKQKTPSTPC